ncbi:MAG: DUF2442 domain-containing protein [Candidatus Margulisbacteria bacterium]|nr:DUF2442 domain-containing protein [Candidatus Margulisiibacteriota bacterium]
MNPRVQSVVPKEDFTLELLFSNGEVKHFDMHAYLEIGVFRELKNLALFKTAKADHGTVQWVHEQELCPDTLYLKSKK